MIPPGKAEAMDASVWRVERSLQGHLQFWGWGHGSKVQRTQPPLLPNENANDHPGIRTQNLSLPFATGTQVAGCFQLIILIKILELWSRTVAHLLRFTNA